MSALPSLTGIASRGPASQLVPPGALKVTSSFEGMKKRQASDLGAESTEFSYRLVWESLDANRDQARPLPWPEASELKVIKVKNP